MYVCKNYLECAHACKLSIYMCVIRQCQWTYSILERAWNNMSKVPAPLSSSEYLPQPQLILVCLYVGNRFLRIGYGKRTGKDSLTWYLSLLIVFGAIEGKILPENNWDGALELQLTTLEPWIKSKTWTAVLELRSISYDPTKIDTYSYVPLFLCSFSSMIHIKICILLCNVSICSTSALPR